MGGAEVAEMIAILAIFLGGVVLGVLVIVSVAIRREGRKAFLDQDGAGRDREDRIG